MQVVREAVLNGSRHLRYHGRIIDVHVHYDRTTLHRACSVASGGGLANAVQLFDQWPPVRFSQGLSAWRRAAGSLRRCHVPDLRRIDDDDFGDELRDEVYVACRLGAVGIKIWKELGLFLYDATGKRVAVNDVRLDPLWHAAAKLSLPVLIHVGDPPELWEPLSTANPRWRDIERQPDCWYGRGGFPALAAIQNELEQLVAKHHRTVFIGAHAGCFLTWGELDRWLANYRNFYIDTAAAVSELGKGDVGAVRDLFLKWPDRILFGTDLVRTTWLDYPRYETGRWNLDEYFTRHWRFFETAEKRLEHPIPEQVPWTVSGIDLPDEVLEQLYAANALRVYRRLTVAETHGVPDQSPA